jgi:hypothetical protein
VTESAGAAGGYGSEAFAKLGNLLRDPEQRKQFWLDPAKALSNVGVRPDDIPESVRNTLHDLSYEELRVLARVNQSLDEAGVDPKYKAEMV